MGPIVLLVNIFLLRLCEAEVTPVFVQTGKDLRLEVKEAVTLEENDQIMWTFFSSKEIAKLDSSGKPTVFKYYLGRVEFFPHNQSLLLRKLTKSDSGEYRAKVFGDNPKDLAEYKVTVLDPVPPVKLTVKSCSSVSSNLTVTCSTQDSLINKTFTCDNQNCSEESGLRAESTTSAASLKVYLKNDSIICVLSNQVSRTEDVRKIEELCEEKKGPTPRSHLVATIVVPIFMGIIGVAVFVYRHKKHNAGKREIKENTVYEIPQIANNDKLPGRRPTADASSTSPSTIYSAVAKSVTEASPKAERETLPESLYASVQKMEKSQDDPKPTV